MTKRYSVEQVADMLRCSFEDVRSALAALEAGKGLSAETFCFAGRSWRIAPSDVAKIQDAVARGLKETQAAQPAGGPKEARAAQPAGGPREDPSQGRSRIRRVVRRGPGEGP